MIEVPPERRRANMSLEDRVAALESLVASLNLYIGFFEETKLTTEQRELLYDVAEAESERLGDGGEEKLPRWWHPGNEQMVADYYAWRAERYPLNPRYRMETP